MLTLTREGDREITLTGRIVTGLGQGATFTQIPWAKEQFIARLGVDPYPGTLNLKIEDASHLAALRAIKKEAGIPISPPSADFCAARGFRVVVEDRFPGAIVFPLVPGYPEDTIEIISPVHLKSALPVEDGMLVTVRVSL